jgi:hypothetical protein
MNQELLFTSCNPSPDRKTAAPNAVDVFVTVQFGSLSYIAMSSTPKALAYGILAFLEITIIVLFISSLAAIAVLSSLGACKRNRPLELGRYP